MHERSIAEVAHMETGDLSRRSFLKLFGIGLASIAAGRLLTACGKIGIVPPEESTSTSTQEYGPDISNLPPLQDFFRNSKLGEGARLDTEAQEIDAATLARAKTAVEAELTKSVTYAGAEFSFISFGLVDNMGVRQNVLLAAVTNVPEGDLVPTITPPTEEAEVQLPSALFFVTDTSTEGGGFFVPIGQGEEGSQARAIPLGLWFDQESVYVGFGQDGTPTLALYKINIEEGEFQYVDPYSQKEVPLGEEDVPGPVAKALLSERQVSIPSWADYLPEGYIVVKNEDNSYGIGIKDGENVISIPNFKYENNRFYLNNEEIEINITLDLKMGENKNPVILGEIVSDSDQEGARNIEYYFDGENWKTPENKMTYYPDFDGVFGAAIGITEVDIDESETIQMPSEKVSIQKTFEFDDYGLDLTLLGVGPFVLSGHNIEKVFLNLGTSQEKGYYRDIMSFIYTSDGVQKKIFRAEKRHTVHFYDRPAVAISPELVDELPLGVKMIVDFFFCTSTYPNASERVRFEAYEITNDRGSVFIAGDFGENPITNDELLVTLNRSGSDSIYVDYSVVQLGQMDLWSKR